MIRIVIDIMLLCYYTTVLLAIDLYPNRGMLRIVKDILC